MGKTFRNLAEVAESLAVIASDLAALGKEALLPLTSEITLAEAGKRLYAALGDDDTFEITLSVRYFDGNRQKVAWKIFDGTRFHEAASLADCVNKALLAKAPKPDAIEGGAVTADMLIADPLPL